MQFQLTRERKAILISGGILICFALIYMIAPSVENAYPSAEALELKKLKVIKYKKKVREKLALEKQLNALKQTVQLTEAGLLEGKTTSLAAVEVQQMVSDMIKSAGGQIRTTRVLPTDTNNEETYVSIPIEISGRVTIPQLVDILYAIHTADKLLHIPVIGIRTIGKARAQQTVLTTLTVEGFMKKNKG